MAEALIERALTHRRARRRRREPALHHRLRQSAANLQSHAAPPDQRGQ